MVSGRGTVAVLFEASGVVRDALIRAGVKAVSVDLRPSARPGPHIQGDVFDHLADGWAGAIMHPTCTYLCSSGLHRNHRVPGRNLMMERALDDVRRLMAAPIPAWAIENPRGCIGTRIRPSDQTIQPYQFGDDASKATCLWTQGLPPLVPTRRVAGRMVTDPRNGKRVERWANQTDSGQNRLGPSDDRWAIRSQTYAGIADAMARQWGPVFMAGGVRDLFGIAP